MRQAPVNVVSCRMYEELIHAFSGLSLRRDVHVIVLRSDVTGAFSAGADIRGRVDPPATGGSVAEFRARLARTCYAAILDVSQPTIAALDGYALGAGAVPAACCDIGVASSSAFIGLPEIDAGRRGGAHHLMCLAPQGTMRLMYFTGEPLGASEARDAGLAQILVERGEAAQSALGLAEKIARKRALWDCRSQSQHSPSLRRSTSMPGTGWSNSTLCASMSPRTRSRLFVPPWRSERPSGRGGSARGAQRPARGGSVTGRLDRRSSLPPWRWTECPDRRDAPDAKVDVTDVSSAACRRRD